MSVFSVLRTTPALTFGWVNCLCGALTYMRMTYFLFTTIIGSQFDLVMNVYLGVLIRETSDAMNSSTPNTVIISVQIILSILLLITTTMWGRWLLHNLGQTTEGWEDPEGQEDPHIQSHIENQ